MKIARLEEGTRRVLDYLDAINRQDIPQITACLCPNCTLESPTPAPHGETYRGKEAISQYWQAIFASKEKLHLEIEEIFGLGFRCVVCWRLQWLDEQGAMKTLRGADIFKIREGLIHEQLSYVKSAIEIN